MRALRYAFVFSLAVIVASCASAKKKTPELSEMEGKKVALVSVEGEDTARKVVEVALVNQLVQHGSFILVGKQEIQKAQDSHDYKPGDWKDLTKRVGADYALRAKILAFDADIHEGYDKAETEDSQLEAETGNGKTEQVYKVKVMDANIRVQLDFIRMFDDATRSGVAEGQDFVRAEAKSEAIHLPPKLRFLETLANKAFKEFFERYN